MARPYQPSLLRFLHGATASLVPLAWLSGLLVYSRDDIDIHGSTGLLPWPVAVLFGLCAVSLGR
jgi:hypothetical protein